MMSQLTSKQCQKQAYITRSDEGVSLRRPLLVSLLRDQFHH